MWVGSGGWGLGIMTRHVCLGEGRVWEEGRVDIVQLLCVKSMCGTQQAFKAIKLFLEKLPNRNK